jgi:phosphoglycerate dehydrogenase-like enzyme
MNIVVTNNQDFSEDQKKRLESLGTVTYYDPLPETAEEYLKRTEGADIICSGTAGLKDSYPQLKDVYVTVSFVSVAFLDVEVLKKNNVTLSNAPGANRFAVSEWIIGMMLYLTRNFSDSLNRVETYRVDGALPPMTRGLAENNLTILGQGNIGKQVGEVAKALGMNVRFFKRGDDLAESVKDADVVVDALSSNPSTCKLLNGVFFDAMRQGSYFVSVTRSEIVDEDALLAALDNGKLAGAASDCGGILVGDTEDTYYKKLLNHPNLLVTPHISYSTELTARTGNDIMISNVAAWINGQPQNVVEHN